MSLKLFSVGPLIATQAVMYCGVCVRALHSEHPVGGLLWLALRGGHIQGDTD